MFRITVVKPLLREGRESDMNNHYNINLKEYSRQNRQKQTPGEKLLWSRLRKKQLLNLRFLRQRSIDNYIGDFLQVETKLIIEVDRFTHDEDKYEYDIKRENTLRTMGYEFLRFSEFDVVSKIDAVIEIIYYYLVTHSP